MRIWPHNQLKALILILALVPASEAQVGSGQRKSQDKNHLLGDFGPRPYPPGAGRPLEPGERGSSRNEQGHYSLILPKDNAAHSAELQRSMMQTFGPPRRKGPTDINHLEKTNDGQWLFNSIEDKKLFLRLPREKVVKLLGVPRKNTGGMIQYKCQVKDSDGFLELSIVDDQVQSSKIWLLEDSFDTPK